MHAVEGVTVAAGMSTWMVYPLRTAAQADNGATA